MTPASAPRRRLAFLLALPVIVAAGLGSRVFGHALPRFVASYAGDTLYATMIFAGLGVLAPTWPLGRRGAVALAACVAIEVGQLYHAPWIDGIRATAPGALVLGYGFLWSDLACYLVGVALGATVERLAGRRLGVS